MSYEIIDFHVHPLLEKTQDLTMYKDTFSVTAETFFDRLEKCGISKFCGSVCNAVQKEDFLGKMLKNNESAFKLKEMYGDTYIVGIQIHPDFVEESKREIDKAAEKGVKLVGELVPYLDGWNYDNKNIRELFLYAGKKGMVINIHSNYDDVFEKMIADNKDITIVGAHPGEWNGLFKQIEWLKKYPNYYLDISGNGATRLGTVEKLVAAVGSERILYGSDYPICNPSVFIDSVVNSFALTNEEKQNILADNAKKLLGI